VERGEIKNQLGQTVTGRYPTAFHRCISHVAGDCRGNTEAWNLGRYRRTPEAREPWRAAGENGVPIAEWDALAFRWNSRLGNCPGAAICKNADLRGCLVGADHHDRNSDRHRHHLIFFRFRVTRGGSGLFFGSLMCRWRGGRRTIPTARPPGRSHPVIEPKRWPDPGDPCKVTGVPPPGEPPRLIKVFFFILAGVRAGRRSHARRQRSRMAHAGHRGYHYGLQTFGPQRHQIRLNCMATSVASSPSLQRVTVSFRALFVFTRSNRWRCD